MAPTAWWASAVYGLYTFLITGLQSLGRWDTTMQTGALIIYGVSAVLASLAGARVADHGRARRAVITAMFTLAAAQLSFGLSLHAAAPLSYACLALIALSAYTAFPAQQARLLEDYPDDTAQLMAWNQGSMYAGIMLGAAVGGHVLTRLGFSRLPLICAGLALGGALTSIARTPGARGARPARRRIP